MSYLQYDKKEDRRTVGMPELKAVNPTDPITPIIAPIGGEGKSIPGGEIEEEGLSEDVYAFIVAAPFFSGPFLYAFGVILIKYLVYSILVLGIAEDKYALHTSPPKVQAVKFLLLPVAIAMQEDLIHVYAYAANLKYDDKVLKISPSATKFKLVLSLLLRLIDGLFSLGVNFFVMLTTHDSVIQVFLNFAALHFLQSIDDVFFLLLTKGFFGDNMELMSDICKRIAFPRRKTSGCTKAFDSFLFGLTLLTLIIIYGFVTAVPAPSDEAAE